MSLTLIKCIFNFSFQHFRNIFIVFRTCCQNRDVYKSCSGICGRLFQGLSVQPLGLLHVDGLHFLGEAYLGVGLCQADQGLQLSGVGGHHPAAAAYLSHVNVSLRMNVNKVNCIELYESTEMFTKRVKLSH